MNKYSREIRPGVWVDVYDVLAAFRTGCPALDHAVKKLLAPGQRGAKSREQDLEEAILSVRRSIEILAKGRESVGGNAPAPENRGAIGTVEGVSAPDPEPRWMFVVHRPGYTGRLVWGSGEYEQSVWDALDGIGRNGHVMVVFSKDGQFAPGSTWAQSAMSLVIEWDVISRHSQAVEKLTREEPPPDPEPPKNSRQPVCSRCNDTHQVTYQDECDETVTQNCTACPRPCEKCRAAGIGAYCATTLCPCDCHVLAMTAVHRERDAKKRMGGTTND